MKKPFIKLPTYADKIAFVNYAYDQGWTWVGYTRKTALADYSEEYDKMAGFTGVEVDCAKSRQFRFTMVYNGALHTPVNSPAQFFRYAKRMTKPVAPQPIDEDEEF